MGKSPSDPLNEPHQHEPAQVKQAIAALCAVSDGKNRAAMIANCAQHALGNADIVALATTEIRRALPRDCRERREALARLNGGKSPGSATNNDVPLPAPHPNSKSFEAQYQAIFRVRPVIAPQPLLNAAEARQGAQQTHFRTDPELGRLCVALHWAPELRVWTVIREYVREHDGSGWISRKHLAQVLKEQGIRYSARHLRRLLAGGEGVFWNVTRERVYMRSWGYLAVSLTRAAMTAKIGVPERNCLGAREMLVPVAGSLEAWEAQLYAAWFAYRNSPTISRSQLSELFGRDKTVLRRWENKRLAGLLRVRHNFAHCPNHEAFFEHIPHYATSYVAWVKWKGKPKLIARIRWQLPNTYRVGAIRQHHRKGQASKVRTRVQRETANMPADERRGGWHRLYFDQPETLRRFVRKHPEAEARYVWRGENHIKHGIFEINASGFPLTHRLERAKPSDERAFLLRQEG